MRYRLFFFRLPFPWCMNKPVGCAAVGEPAEAVALTQAFSAGFLGTSVGAEVRPYTQQRERMV